MTEDLREPMNRNGISNRWNLSHQVDVCDDPLTSRTSPDKCRHAAYIPRSNVQIGKGCQRQVVGLVIVSRGIASKGTHMKPRKRW
jgi:hypothetical protein